MLLWGGSIYWWWMNYWIEFLVPDSECNLRPVIWVWIFSSPAYIVSHSLNSFSRVSVIIHIASFLFRTSSLFTSSSTVSASIIFLDLCFNPCNLLSRFSTLSYNILFLSYSPVYWLLLPLFLYASLLHCFLVSLWVFVEPIQFLLCSFSLPLFLPHFQILFPIQKL